MTEKKTLTYQLEEFYPAVFQYRAGENSITYEFKNEDYAKEFERLNKASYAPGRTVEAG